MPDVENEHACIEEPAREEPPPVPSFQRILGLVEESAGLRVAGPNLGRFLKAYDHDPAMFWEMAKDAMARGRNPIALLYTKVDAGEHLAPPLLQQQPQQHRAPARSATEPRLDEPVEHVGPEDFSDSDFGQRARELLEGKGLLREIP